MRDAKQTDVKVFLKMYFLLQRVTLPKYDSTFNSFKPYFYYNRD